MNSSPNSPTIKTILHTLFQQLLIWQHCDYFWERQRQPLHVQVQLVPLPAAREGVDCLASLWGPGVRWRKAHLSASEYDPSENHAMIENITKKFGSSQSRLFVRHWSTVSSPFACARMSDNSKSKWRQKIISIPKSVILLKHVFVEVLYVVSF